jgi:FkbM family methyltransferase
MWAPKKTAGFVEVMQRYCSSPQNLVVDAGANIGWYCTLAVAFGCRCMAFDGNLEALQYLKMTKKLNGWSESQMRIVPALLSNTAHTTFDGWSVFNVMNDEASEGSQSKSGWFTTTTTTLNNMVTEQPIFLKVDVEGKCHQRRLSQYETGSTAGTVQS